VLSGLRVEVLSREPQVVGEDPQSRRILIRRVVPERIAPGPLPAARVGRIGDEPWRAQVVRPDVEDIRPAARGRGLEHRDRHVAQPHRLLDRGATRVVLADEMSRFVIGEVRIRPGRALLDSLPQAIHQVRGAARLLHAAAAIVDVGHACCGGRVARRVVCEAARGGATQAREAMARRGIRVRGGSPVHRGTGAIAVGIVDEGLALPRGKLCGDEPVQAVIAEDLREVAIRPIDRLQMTNRPASW